MAYVDRTLASRHECKYFVAPDVLPALRALSRPFVRADAFAQRAMGHRYRLASLYLDGPDLALYRSTTEGHRNRFKLRMRAYSDDPATPVYLEIKRRVDRVVRKRRVRVTREVAARIARGESPGAIDDPRVAEFVLDAAETAATPMLRVRYEREAYESRTSDPVRMTFDSALAYAPYDPAAPFAVGGGGWRAAPLEGVIVEMKFTDRCPSWMTRIIEELQLSRESIPKYVICVDHAQGRGDWTTLFGAHVARRALR